MQRDEERVREDQLIVAFLRAHPGWLAAHPELYAVLEPPRRLHGETVADHMAAMVEQARRHGSDAAADRRAADGFTQLVQDLVVALMRAPDPIACLTDEGPGLLRVDSVRLCAETGLPGAAPLPPGAVERTLGQRPALLRAAVRDPSLHGEAAPLARREALVRVPVAAGPALLALGSRDPDGLDGAATPSLAFLGQAVAAAVDRA